ncbi:S41 family peptidase [Patescibacteria group bacterium]|nr:S41 family peptidase [Patescibacteria group bacterium]MBU4274714.1 S41 family peptidase [Patescibacteria group bacterium]MBU4367859.1 S41 family peptidase [Patescibacteria group bacterium]MBU4461686.1 S41 family peptidase [Patescibacteria group bacterium]MCG2700307.1 S41 family peptidase [Candidatus Parcubacteria bacterium]
MKTLKRILSFAFLVVAFLAVFYSGIFYGKNLVVCEVCAPTDVNFSLFWTAYNQLKEKFVDPSKITNQSILYGAISGMAQSLGDPYTTFFNPTDAKKFEQELSGYFDGIGIEIGIKKEQLTVIAPLEGTPAQKAGLRAGDKIVKINDQDAVGITTDEAVTLIRGQKGTKIILTIYRSGWTETKDFTITRDTIKIPSLEWTLIGDDIAHLEIYQFSQSLVFDFNTAAFEILNSKAQKIILDLRNNPGGYLEVAQDIAGWFLEKDKVVVIEDFGNGKEPQIYKASGNEKFSQYPMVILINQGSASASEILAGALKDNRGIQLIGEKSFGKGSVQEGINLKDDSYLKITIAKWLTPNGLSISDKGLDPDIKVELTDEDYEQDKDPQLEKAIEILENIR